MSTHDRDTPAPRPGVKDLEVEVETDVGADIELDDPADDEVAPEADPAIRRGEVLRLLREAQEDPVEGFDVRRPPE